ncbi:MAG: M20/M25/M40 family metallo-hydrolase, partial [Candidatus Lindowbacteria bacterium]|nr:M20/M25/M40 family metallo-hydrolase [Candidatus Lindowbacteria bacterium]
RKLVIPAFRTILASNIIFVLALLTKLLAGKFTWLTPFSWFFFALCVLGGVIFLLFRLFLFSKVPVMGANDNLAGVSVAVAAARRFAQHRPQGTEVWAVSFGAEECGLRGSKRFAARHHIELSNAYLVNIEMVGAGSMIVVAGEKSAGTKHSPEVVSLIVEAARRCGIVVPTVVAPFGETDATPFTRLRLKASTLAAIDDQNFPPNWHVFDDVPENVDEAKLLNALKICVEYVNMLEK